MAELINTNVFEANKKFVDFAGLDYFWTKAKAYIDGVDASMSAKVVTLEDVVGDSTKGLVKDVKSIQDELNSLSGGAGSIASQINNAITALDLPNTYDAKGAASDALDAANAYTDGKDSAMNTRVTALETAKDDYKAYADQAELDAVATANAYTDGKDSAMNTRVTALEAIDHDKLASDAAASAVATVLDGAPAKFDTLKEIAEWIAEADTAEDAVSLVTRVNALEAIDHDAYKAADETNLAAAKAYADQAEADAIAAAKTETESQVAALANGAVKANADAIAVINNPDASVEGSIAKAKADAIAAALAKIAELDVANVYETKSDASAKLEAAKAYTDEVAGVYSSEGVEASGLRKEIEDNEKVTSAALNELDGRVADLEEHKDDYMAYADQAEADAIATANAFASTYTDTLFESIKFASETDIDGIFTKAEA